MLILVGPSASGKTLVVQMLIKYHQMKKLVTYTTRNMRQGEINDIDYHFISKDLFLDKIKDGFFLEYVNYNNNYYGTSFEEISKDKVVILEPSGIKHYKEKLKDDATIIFLTCDEEILKQRMKNRGDSDLDIAKRIIVDSKVFNNEAMSYADYIIDTSNLSIEEMTEKVYELYN